MSLTKNGRKLQALLQDARNIAVKERARLRQDVRKADLAVSDIYHDIEYSRNISFFNSGRTVKSLQAALKHRRKMKDELSNIEALMGALDRNILIENEEDSQ
ncbi:hypothetical protein [Ornithinibacillus sp. FSL M8-0202]|uniref:hypothetical protein n=1 Tax=Ornithinibacillus sp. FSL M8-0202 TaxID=2921616 RepID=UPI0030D019F7